MEIRAEQGRGPNHLPRVRACEDKGSRLGVRIQIGFGSRGDADADVDANNSSCARS